MLVEGIQITKQFLYLYVKIFSVWDDEGKGSGFVGYLYLDLHSRPGKYGHAANFSL